MIGLKERVIDWLLKTLKGRSPSDYKEMQEYYQSRISYMKKELEEQKKIIESYRHKHPGNGEELDAWKSREEKMLQEKLIMMKKIMELESQLMFWDKLHKK